MPINKNTLSSMLDEQDADRARRAAISAPKVSADDLARSRQLAQRYSAPTLAVADNLPEYAERAELDDLSEAAKRNPALGRWAAKPTNAPFARQDLGPLNKVVAALAMTTPGRLFVDAYSDVQGALPWVKKQRQAEVRKANPNGVVREQPRTFGDDVVNLFRGGFEGGRGGLEHLLPSSGPATSEAVWRGLGYTSAKDYQLAQQAGSIAASTRAEQRFTGQVSGETSRQMQAASEADTFRDAVVAVIQNPRAIGGTMAGSAGRGLPGLAFTAAAGAVSPWAVAGAAGGTSAATEYAASIQQSMAEEGVDATQAWQVQAMLADEAKMNSVRTRAAKRGVTVGAFDAVTAGLAGRLIAGAKPTALSRGTRVAGEAGLQMGGGAGGETAAQLINGEKLRPADIVMEAFAELPTAVAEVPGNVRTIRQREQRQALETVSASVDGARRIEDITNAVAESKTAKAAPDAVAELVREAAPDERVYLAPEQARTLFQTERVTADAFVDGLLGPGALREAEASGADLVIPMDVFAERIATLPNAQDVVQHVRSAPEHLSRAELADTAKLDEVLASLFPAEEAAPTVSLQNDTSAQVADDVVQMLTATGQFRKSDAQLQGNLWGRVFQRLAERSGTDAWAIYERYNTRINGPDWAPQAQASQPVAPKTLLQRATDGVRSLFQSKPSEMAQTESPEFRRWFGDSKVVDEKGEPLVVYHGTAADFDAFSESKHRTSLNDKYQGDGFHFSASPDVASKYADAARNQYLDKARTLALVDEKMPPLVARTFRTVVEDGYDAAWDGTEAEHQAVFDEAEAAGISLLELNSLLDLAEWVEGSNYDKGRERSSFHAGMIFGGGGRWLPDWARDSAVRFGLQDALPNPAVMPVYLKVENVLRTDDSEAAKRARAEGYDGVYYTGEGTVDGEPEWIVFRPEQIKSATGNRGTFDPKSPSILYQPAYHGTPHTVDRFSLQKIGTGEGAQAYGWGLYFASEKAIAQHYRDTLRHPVVVDGTPLDRMRAPMWQGALANMFQNRMAAGLDQQAARDQTVRWAEGNRQIEDKQAARDFVSRLSEGVGNLYQVEVPEDSDLLDYDKPLSEQPDGVRERLEKAGLFPLHGHAFPRGKSVYDVIAERVDDAQNGGAEYWVGQNIPGWESKRPEQAASEYLQSIGIPGLRYLDGGSRADWQLTPPSQTAAGDWMVKDRSKPDSKGLHFANEADARAELERRQKTSHNYVIWDEAAISEPQRLLEQRRAETERGQIRIAPDRTMAIDLFANADASTFLHESMHFFLEVMQDVAVDSPQVRADLDALRAWVGNGGGEFTTEQHEQIARGFEAYLWEGKAPSSELARAFARIKAWFRALYQSLDALDVQLSDEVRSVFDRMIATETEIEAASVSAGIAPIDIPDDAKAILTPARWARYVQSLADAKDEAEAELLAKTLKTLRREKKEWWKAQSAKVREEVEAELEASPTIRAWRVLSGKSEVNGQPVPEVLRGLRLDKDAVVEAIMRRESLSKSEAVQRVQDAYGSPRVYALAGGVSPDEAAGVLGFGSGEGLLVALADAPRMEARIGDEVKSRMLARHGDPLNDGSLPALAMKSVHNSKRITAMGNELEMLATLANQPVPPIRFIREYARRQIAGMTLRSLRPNEFLVAERKAGRLATISAAKGDYAGALRYKRQQTTQAALYSEAIKAQRKATAHVNALRKAAKPATIKRIGKAGKLYVDALKSILEGHEFRAVTGRTVSRRGSLREWVKQQQDLGLNTAVPEDLLARIEAESVVNVADLTLTQLAEMREAVTNLLHLARLKNELLANGRARDYAEAKEEMIAALDKLESVPRNAKEKADMTTFERLLTFKDAAFNWLLQPETMVEWLDGGRQGIFHDVLWNESERAEAKRNELQRNMAGLMKTAFESISAEGRADLDRVRHIEGVGDISGHTIFSALLNMGNEGNRAKLTQGGRVVKDSIVPWTEDQLAAMFRTLSGEQANLAQGIWDAVNSLWPEIVAMEEALSGFAPPKIEASAVTIATRDGPVALQGGYYPVRYDQRGSRAGAQAEDEMSKRMLAGQTPIRATTSKGHLEKRTEYVAALKLDYHQILTEHLSGVMSDIAYRRFLTQVYRVLGDTDITRRIDNRLGRGASKAMQQAFERGAVGQFSLAGPLYGPWQGVADATMTNISVAALGFRVPLAVANTVTAPILASSRISPAAIAKGLAAYYADMKGSIDLIHALSPTMLKRSEARTVELNAMLDSIRHGKQTRRWLVEMAFSVHQWIVPLMENGLWMAEYMRSQEQGLSIQESVRLADKLIRQTQTKHQAKDLSQVEANPYLRPLMMFAGPLVIINNRLQESGLRGGLHGDVTSISQALGVWIAMAAGGSWLFEMLMGRGPDDEDEDGDEDVSDWMRWCAKKLALMPFSAIPVLRDVVTTLDSGFSPQHPLLQASSNVTKLSKEASKAFDVDEDVDRERLAKLGLKAAGVVYPIPTNQAMRTGTYLMEVGTGQHTPDSPLEPWYLLQGPPKDE